MSPPIQSKPQYSLQTRLVLAFGVLLILFLGLAGFVLDRAFKESVAVAVEESLQLQVYALLGVAELDTDGFFLPDLEEARFSQIDSGLYGFILDGRQQEVWRSPSALNITFTENIFSGQGSELGETVFGTTDMTQQGSLSYANYGTYWADQDQSFSFIVMESTEPTDAEINRFQSGLWVGLGGLAVVLSIAQYFLLRWSMRPLQHLAEDVAEIESGEKDQLKTDYPSELQAVSNNLNLLIKSERERQARYRTTLGDLAHSLKTPLAVCFGIIETMQQLKSNSKFESELVSSKDVTDMEEQLERMNQIVSYQLKRAVEPNTNKVLGKPVQVVIVCNKILSALNKVYMDKNVKIENVIEEQARFYGAESDLMELSGNLLDNAFKYCEQAVVLKVRQIGKKLYIEINDDGKGIAEADQQWVLQRGARVDTIKSGQGIGLAVAVDIISSYGGSIEVGRSELGGARIRVEL